MKAEKTSGAKIAPFYNPQEDYTQAIDAERYALENNGRELVKEGYVIELGCRYHNGVGMSYAGSGDAITADMATARMFDTWRDAMRHTLDAYEIPELDLPIPRGYEKPKFPRVCHVRLWAEVTDC